MSRFELLDEIDLPFPLGGCFGFWGYDLKNFTEPKLPRRAVNDLELPDCHVGFYDSLVVFDHQLGKVLIVSTGLDADGSRSEKRAKEQLEFWQTNCEQGRRDVQAANMSRIVYAPDWPRAPITNLSRAEFHRRRRTRPAIHPRRRHLPGQPVTAADGAPMRLSRLGIVEKLIAVSPAPFSAFLDCGEFQIASSSPEQFLRMSGSHIVTRPIKGTRPRAANPTRDAQLAYELQTSAKELAELVMITDLLRNDLGKVCEFGRADAGNRQAGKVRAGAAPRFHRRRPVAEGCDAFCGVRVVFPGGSITGAPKFRAMEIIDELEPMSRGPYCGAIGYLGFNRESQLSITIRTAICKDGLAHFNVGAGIVADSNPEAEYEETLAKAAGFLAALKLELPNSLFMVPRRL